MYTTYFIKLPPNNAQHADQTHQTECLMHIEFKTNAKLPEHLTESLGYNAILSLSGKQQPPPISPKKPILKINFKI